MLRAPSFLKDRLPGLLLALAVAGACPPGLAAAPSHFSTVIGHSLLCLNELDTGAFQDYLQKHFGPPYKHEQGALWFKASSLLWGVPVSDIMLSDSDSEVAFIAAVVDVPPEQLESAIVATMGIHHRTLSQDKFPVREAQSGSNIIYFDKKSKIYCAKSEYLHNGRVR